MMINDGMFIVTVLHIWSMHMQAAGGICVFVLLACSACGLCVCIGPVTLCSDVPLVLRW
jgi:hypothetical protein